MGRYYSGYVGPVLLVPRVEKTSEKKIWTCPNKSCKFHLQESSSNFCTLCGSKIQKDSITVKGHYSIFDLEEEFGIESDTFADMAYECDFNEQEKCLVLIPNAPPFPKEVSRTRIEQDDLLEIREDNIKESVTNFENHYKDIIDRIKAKMPETKVVFAVVNSYS